MYALEAFTFWGATLCYSGSFALATMGAVWKRERLRGIGFWLFCMALLLHAISFTARWLHGGRAPIVSAPEAMSMTVLLLAIIFVALVLRAPQLWTIGAPVALVALLIMGWSRVPQHLPEPLSPALDTIWLFIHATFATLAAGCFLIATGGSVMWLRRGNGDLPRDRLETLIPRLNFLGFIFWGVMIASGAIWANLAWGRYWGWDPIEIWSLVSWLLYALLMHLMFTLRWSMRSIAWYSIFATLTVIFSLWGVGYLYQTIHTYG
jgi:ABC-type transport system involved in cytochrome c biogenesis permease subunit